MANKKISQLNAVDPAIGIGSVALFPMVSGTGPGDFQTAKATALEIASFVLNPIPIGPNGSDIPSIGFTGASNIYFDKSNWVDTSDAGTHAFVMVDKDNGQLTTGSGIGVVANGDNMGDCKATQNVNMQNNSIINIASLFFNQTASTVLDEDGTNLSVQAGTDLTLSGIRHVHISGQALDLASTPISGDVTFSQGGLTIPDGQGLTGDNIVGDDVVINKTSRHLPYNADLTVDWSDSNIQYDIVDPSNLNYVFSNAKDGQTVTMYVQNTSAATAYTPTFTSGTPNTVLWGGTGGPPHVEAKRTNVYTFAAIHTGIFASAITGYVY